jgi:hypothetical protein
VALLGGIAGATDGLAGEALAGWLGGSAIADGAISGFAGGIVGDSAQQGAAMLLGWRPCFSIPEALASGAVGGVLGGVGGWWAESRGATATAVAPPSARPVFPSTPEEFDAMMGFEGVRSGNASNKVTWEFAEGNWRVRYEEHPLQPGEDFNPRHHGPHWHVDFRPPGAGWGNPAAGQIERPGYVPGSGHGFVPGEPLPQ